MLFLTRLWLRFLSAVAPRVAGRVGARLWFRVQRPTVSAESRAFLATGERFETRTKDTRIVGWRWGSGPTVLLMHGWGGYGAQVQPFVEPLVRSGYRVVLFDAPSHGESGPSAWGPKSATLFDFADALVAVSEGAGPIAGVIAHSGGCAAAAWTLVRAPAWRPARMVFIAPFGSPARYMDVFSKTLGLSDAAMVHFRADTEKALDFRWADFEVPNVPTRVATPPLLVIHDKNDRVNSWQDGADIAAAWPNARLETTTGLGHNRILSDANAVASATAFITAR
ncbi:MAG TPA: alpha/beta fold hydrolase [Gemmatimonadaceae bacterium]